jgi:hypothetical protein
MNNEQERKELKDLSQSFASEIEKFKKLIGYEPVTPSNPDKSDPATNAQIQGCMNAIYSVANNLHQRMDRLQASHWSYQDSHAEGHLPAIKGAGAMNKALASLGLDKDFVAEKKKIYASKDLFEIKNK